jgi:hypothetical protein
MKATTIIGTQKNMIPTIERAMSNSRFILSRINIPAHPFQTYSPDTSDVNSLAHNLQQTALWRLPIIY